MGRLVDPPMVSMRAAGAPAAPPPHCCPAGEVTDQESRRDHAWVVWARRISCRAAIVWVLLGVAWSTPAAGQVAATEYEGAAAVGLALRQLGTTKRVLMIAAHPDDEATQVLSALALGEGADVAYLSLTRGEGGQNGIGGELQEGLGLVRSEELLAARRLDGARQYFTRAIDYGFSKDADEAFRHWPREDLLRDVVAVIRHFRPDVIVSVFSGTPRDGHGQHQAAGIMAREGFVVAADPARFPSQATAGLRPHAATHLYQLLRGPDDSPAAEIATGELDPLLGRSHFQVAMASRSRHRSQDMGRLLTPGPQATTLTLLDSRLDESGSRSLFAGVDTTLSAHARTAAAASGGSGGTARPTELFGRYESAVAAVRDGFNPLRPERIVPRLAAAALMLEEAVRGLEADQSADADLRFRVDVERRKLSNALRRAAGIELDAIASDEAVVPGQTFEIELRLWNGGSDEVEVTSLEPLLPAGWAATPLDEQKRTVAPGELMSRRFEVTIPVGAEVTQPYFLGMPRDGARYAWPDEVAGVGLPFQDDPVGSTAEFAVQGVSIRQDGVAMYQGLDRRSGEFRRPVRVVPAVALAVEPGLAVLPITRRGEPLRVSVSAAAEEPGGIAGELRLTAPEGWRIEPAVVPLAFADAGEERIIDFSLHAPPDLDEGHVRIASVFTDASGRSFEQGYVLVDYPHIRPRPLYRPAALDVRAVDVEIPGGLRVGYVAAAGDNVPQALSQLGVAVEPLDGDDLAAAPLGVYDVIVVGSRAYEGRPDLLTHNQRLLEYVRSGGTMIVQYNQYEYTRPGIAPYPVSMARPHDRVTDETAEVTMLEPEHAILSSPNRITADDFDGWVQERGLYFLNTWDEQYTPLLEMADPGEAPKGGSLLVAEYGEGTYVYVGLALFRQLPAGVPGAYRLFANLLALGARP
jgi:LmbE family N-acetylglucosaminyl deacetylase